MTNLNHSNKNNSYWEEYFTKSTQRLIINIVIFYHKAYNYHPDNTSFHSGVYYGNVALLRVKFYVLLQDTATAWLQGSLLCQNMRPCGVKKRQPLSHSQKKIFLLRFPSSCDWNKWRHNISETGSHFSSKRV